MLEQDRVTNSALASGETPVREREPRLMTDS